jgi:hypothetical protein
LGGRELTGEVDGAVAVVAYWRKDEMVSDGRGRLAAEEANRKIGTQRDIITVIKRGGREERKLES